MVQHKKSEPFDIADLPELTESQRKFVEGILAGKSAIDAYTAAYNCENSARKTLWTEASRAKHHPKIALWISAARQAGLGNPKINRDQHIQRLERLSELCVLSGNMGAAVQAEQLIGKASGHYTEKLEVSGADPLATLEDIAKEFGEDVAAAIASTAGMQRH